MKKNRFFLLFAFAMFIMLPFSVNAESVNNSDEFINALGGSEYAKLINNQIILQQNITLTETISLESGTYTLDLNGKTISDDKYMGSIIKLNDATLTINDSIGNGTIESTFDNDSIQVREKGNLTINGGNFSGKKSITSYKDSSLTINDGYFESENSAILYYGGNVTINDGIFKSNFGSVINQQGNRDSNQTLTINGGNFEGMIPFEYGSGNFVINAGNFKGEKCATLILINYISEKSKINEGQFDGGIWLYQVDIPVITVESGSIYELVPTLLGKYSIISPSEYMSKIDVSGHLLPFEEVYSSESNITVKKTILDANGGTINGKSQYVIEDYTNSNALPTPTREGYYFKGWYTKPIGGKYISDFDEQFSKGVTYYAHWDKEGTVSIDFANMEVVSEIPSIEGKWLDYLEDIGLIIFDSDTNSVKNKDEKVLMTIDADNKMKITNGLTVADNIIHDLTPEEKEQLRQEGETDIPDRIEVIFSTIPAPKLIFDANGGVFKNNITTIDIEDVINFDYDAFEKPTRKGYKFIGFYTENDKSYLEVMSLEAGVEEDTTFYAKWELDENVPQTFDGIGTSIFMGTISLIGLVGATIYFRKRNKVRA